MSVPSSARVYDLSVEYGHHATVDEVQPRLSWRLSDPRRGVCQRAWRVRVETRSGTDAWTEVWDSGRVDDARQRFVPYAGPALPARTQVRWQVQVWDQDDQPTAWSDHATWEVGLPTASDWSARWIAGDRHGSRTDGVQAPLLRREFTLPAKPVRARLYLTALGLVEARINGQPVGDDVFAPGWTDYRKRVLYRAFDVTGHLQAGANAIGAMLGDGWWCGQIAVQGREAYGDRPWLLAQLEVTCADGSVHRVASDASWTWHDSPILRNDMLQGEDHDARQEIPGWDRPDLDPLGWLPVRLGDFPGMAIQAALGPAVRAHETLAPVAPPANRGGFMACSHLVDFGQNLVGRVRLRIRAKAGTRVLIRHGETIDASGRLYVANLRGARCVDSYTCAGGDEVVWEPRFTFHGFRHVEITLPNAGVESWSVEAVVLHSATTRIGAFSSDHPLLDRLQQNIWWGQRGNFIDIPSDCPQRDERMGWLGDAQVFAPTACFNADAAGFFAKWAQDLADAQNADGSMPPVAPQPGALGGDGGPAWADALILVPHAVWRATGDLRPVERLWPVFERFIAYLETTCQDGIREHADLGRWGGFGDWLAQDGSGRMDGGTPKDLIGTAFLARDAACLAELAEALGKTAEAARWRQRFSEVRTGFIRRFISADGLLAAQTQTAYVLALRFGLAPDDLIPAEVRALVRDIQSRGNHLSTGFVGTPHLLHVLSDAEQVEVAYALLLQTSYPSWLFPVTQGATTIWERWDGWTKDKGFQDVEMNSFNHYAYGAVGEWMYGVVAGISALTPGWSTIRYAPRPGGGLTKAQASTVTPAGPVAIAWHLDQGRLHLELTVPPNTQGEVIIPTSDPTSVELDGHRLDEDAGIRVLARTATTVTVAVGAGRYQFTAAKIS